MITRRLSRHSVPLTLRSLGSAFFLDRHRLPSTLHRPILFTGSTEKPRRTAAVTDTDGQRRGAAVGARWILDRLSGDRLGQLRAISVSRFICDSGVQIACDIPQCDGSSSDACSAGVTKSGSEPATIAAFNICIARRADSRFASNSTLRTSPTPQQSSNATSRSLGLSRNSDDPAGALCATTSA
jgi:hypothetical protein